MLPQLRHRQWHRRIIKGIPSAPQHAAEKHKPLCPSHSPEYFDGTGSPRYVAPMRDKGGESCGQIIEDLTTGVKPWFLISVVFGGTHFSVLLLIGIRLSCLKTTTSTSLRGAKDDLLYDS